MPDCKSRTSMGWFHSITGFRKARWFASWCGRSASRNATSNFTATAAAVGTGAVLSGAMLVHSSICKNVLVFKARNRYSQGRTARAERANDVKGDAQFTTPFGIHHAAASFGPIATAHMARYGTTTLDFAHLAVTERSHAALNKKAMMRKPITID